MKGFPLRYAVYFLAAVYLFADLHACHGPLHRRITAPPVAGEDGGGLVARVYGRGITLLELEEALRDHLWRRGENWPALSSTAKQQTRQLVAENLVNDRMIRAFRIMNGLDAPARVATAAADELSVMTRQFPEPGDFERRLQWRHLSETELSEQMREAALDEAWIEEKIAHRLAEVTEESARAWYDEHRQTLATGARHRAAHIYLTRHEADKPDREPEIREIHRRLISGEATFEALAAEFSEDERSKNIGGDLGWFTAERMPADFMRTVEALRPEQMSAPVLTELGWHVVKLIARQEGGVPSFESVREEILAHLRNERRAAAVRALIAELRTRSMRPTQFLFHHPEVIARAEPAPMEWRESGGS